MAIAQGLPVDGEQGSEGREPAQPGLCHQTKGLRERGQWPRASEGAAGPGELQAPLCCSFLIAAQSAPDADWQEGSRAGERRLGGEVARHVEEGGRTTPTETQPGERPQHLSLGAGVRQSPECGQGLRSLKTGGAGSATALLTSTVSLST